MPRVTRTGEDLPGIHRAQRNLHDGPTSKFLGPATCIELSERAHNNGYTHICIYGKTYGAQSSQPKPSECPISQRKDNDLP